MLEKTEEQSIVAENDVTALQNIKHPLEHMWHFWFFTNKSKNWETNQVELTSFGTVEDYWCLYHHMKLPSELRLGQDYAIFKDGIRPMWEDAANKSGGRWLINGLKNHNVDSVWTDTVLQVIGENFIHSDIICGVVVNVRAESKVSIWTRIKDPKANKEIGLRLKSHFGLQNEIHYLAHKRNSSLFTV